MGESSTFFNILFKVGVDECLHIEIKIFNIHLHLRDFVQGCIKFIINQLQVRSMIIHLERRETVISQNKAMDLIDTVVKF